MAYIGARQADTNSATPAAILTHTAYTLSCLLMSYGRHKSGRLNCI